MEWVDSYNPGARTGPNRYANAPLQSKIFVALYLQNHNIWSQKNHHSQLSYTEWHILNYLCKINCLINFNFSMARYSHNSKNQYPNRNSFRVTEISNLCSSFNVIWSTHKKLQRKFSTKPMKMVNILVLAAFRWAVWGLVLFNRIQTGTVTKMNRK